MSDDAAHAIETAEKAADADGLLAPAGRSEVTRTQLLVTAERLFAERGIDNVSMRQIATAARQRNHFVVQYHFGSKEALVDEILDMRRAAVNEARRPLLEALPAPGRSDRTTMVRAIVATLVGPLADRLDDEESYFLRLLDQAMSATTADGTTRYPLTPTTASSETGVEAVNRLTDAMPELDEETLALRVGFALTLMLRTLADREGVEHGAAPPATPRARFVEELIASMTAVLIRDLPAETPTRRRRARRR